MSGTSLLVVTVAEGLKLGGTLRVLAAADSEDEVQLKLEGLDNTVLGRVAVVEVKAVYERRPAVQNVPSSLPLLDRDR